MGLEAATYINQLNPLNPVGAVDPKSQGDDHIRMIKAAIQASFPNITGAITATQAQLNAVGASGITGFAIAANKVKGNTAAGAGAATTALRSDVTMQLDLADGFSFTGTHLHRTGSAGAPTFAFISDATSGMYSGGVNDLRFAVGGALALQMQPTFFAPLQPVRAIDGSAGTPSFSFFSDSDTGLYRVGADQIGIATGGAVRIAVSTASLTANIPFRLADGTVGAPSYAFDNDNDTGFYKFGLDDIGISTGGNLAARFGGGATPFFVSPQIFLTSSGTAGSPAITFSAVDTDTGIYRIGADQLGFSEGGVGFRIGFRNVPVSATTTTLVAADNGKCIPITAAINIPASVMSAGDCVSIYNDSAGSLNITISAGTLRLAGTTSTGTRAVGPRGMATLWFRTGGATPEVICSGAGVS